MRNVLAAAVAAVGMAVSLPAVAMGDTFVGQVKIKHHTVSMNCPVTFPVVCQLPQPGNEAVLKVVFPGGGFSTIDQLCLTFHFKGDLVDPGDWLAWGAGQGFFNGGTTPIATRTSCQIGSQPGISDLLDGHQRMDAWMFTGSARLISVDATITGTR
jgi:hypothetical protein